MTELIGVNIRKTNNMRAIGSMCPGLEKVQFRCFTGNEEVDKFGPFLIKELNALLTTRLINVIIYSLHCILEVNSLLFVSR